MVKLPAVDFIDDKGGKPIGKLHTAVDEASRKGWTLVNMKADWKTIFAN